jgi:hypothetical protein
MPSWNDKITTTYKKCNTILKPPECDFQGAEHTSDGLWSGKPQKRPFEGTLRNQGLRRNVAKIQLSTNHLLINFRFVNFSTRSYTNGDYKIMKESSF